VFVKKIGVLQHRLSEVIATMGHGDMLVVADAGLPVPPGVERFDLAVSPGLPSMLDVSRAIAGELHVERSIVAEELESGNAALVEEIETLFPAAEHASMSHDDFKVVTARARAIVRTGECTPYANVILVSGVTF
jgi:D-ribose pyranase